MEILDLALFKDPVYVNIVIGVSMVLISDVFFIHVLPVLVESYGFENTDITFILTVFFTADLVGKIIFGIISSIFQIQNRHIVLIGSIFTVLFRMGNISTSLKICMDLYLFLFSFHFTLISLVVRCAISYSWNFTMYHS